MKNFHSQPLFFLLLLLLISFATRVQAQNAVDFDGINDYVSVPNASALIANGNISMALWVYPTNPSPNYPNFDGIIGFRNDINADFYLLHLTTTTLEARFRNSAGTNFNTSVTGITLNTWQHLVMTYDGSTLKVYRNGVLNASVAASGTITSTTTPFNIGYLPYSSANFYLDGRVDDACLWNKALTANEVSVLYNACGPNLADANLKLCYEFNQGTAGGNNTSITQAIDSKGNINGTFNGFAMTGTVSNFIAYGTGTYGTISPSATCSYTSPSGNYTWNYSGTYHDTIQNSNGCDSLMTINLTINGNGYATLSPKVCTSYTSPSGNYTWTNSGTYHDTITSAAGCDSVLTINLTVKGASASQVVDSACLSYLSPSGNYTWTTSGVYHDTILTSLGCDSTMTILLTILERDSATLSPQVCDQYVSPSGKVWTTSGTYVDTVYNVNACDSIYVINLTVTTVDTGVTLNGESFTANASGAIYQWLDCDQNLAIIGGATAQSFWPSQTGNYAVVVTQNGCSDTSSCIYILLDGLDELFSRSIQVSPNPNAGNFTVSLGQNYTDVTTEMLNLTGQVLERKSFSRVNSINLHSNVSQGLYLLKVTADGRQGVIKVRVE
ncbi:MAG: T9SS type A sorting domain-containing protein [Bacteroidia bacterium]|nr:T9SS type A sorting domain-containing protein [Bacteroidia bacterium]